MNAIGYAILVWTMFILFADWKTSKNVWGSKSSLLQCSFLLALATLLIMWR